MTTPLHMLLSPETKAYVADLLIAYEHCNAWRHNLDPEEVRIPRYALGEFIRSCYLRRWQTAEISKVLSIDPRRVRELHAEYSKSPPRMVPVRGSLVPGRAVVQRRPMGRMRYLRSLSGPGQPDEVTVTVADAVQEVVIDPSQAVSQIPAPSLGAPGSDNQ